ncbi:hypothetical protein PG985_002539 [Apiospora marii]|uniref:Uncharacterized protein n=1 Tax=Apiospora marii TaxID=335849 RepID=A0ABR1RV98_9PEZI
MDPVRSQDGRHAHRAPTPSLPYSTMTSNAMAELIDETTWDCLPENGNVAAHFQDTRWCQPTAVGQELCTEEALPGSLDQSFPHPVSFDTNSSGESIRLPGTLLSDEREIEAATAPLNFLTPITPYIQNTPYGHVNSSA